MAVSNRDERFHTIVIGGGQAGLSVGYHLKRRGLPFVVLDAHTRVGDAWRRRWDSLHLFTPAKFDGLDGMRFPAAPNSFPTKDQMADYLESYAARFELPVRTGVRVERLVRENGHFVVFGAGRRFEADNVVVAVSTFQEPALPAFATELDERIVQLHSFAYRNPAQLRPGGVLVVGAGNSGAEIAKELVRTHPTWMSGRDTGHIPFRIDGWAGRTIMVRLVLKVIFHHILTVNTPIGRKVRPQILSRGGPLIRVKPKELAALGVERVPRTVGARDGKPLLADGRVLDVANVVWCTGFHPGFSWIDMPVLGEREPRHTSGVVPDVPGLYFVGLHFLHALSSEMIHGVGRDARRIVERLATREASSADMLEQEPSTAAA